MRRGSAAAAPLPRSSQKKSRGHLAACLLFAAILLLGFGLRAVAFFLPGQNPVWADLYRDAQGEPYLTDPDSYFYLRQAEQMAETGRPCLFLPAGADALRGARLDAENEAAADPMLLPFLTWLLWRLQFFLFPVSVVQVARWIGPLFGSLAALPVFLYLRRRVGLFGAAVGALMIETSIPLVTGTTSGVFDTDALLGLLPLSQQLLHIRSLQEPSGRRQLLFGAGSAVCFGLLSCLWTGAPAYFWLMAVSGLLCCLAHWLRGAGRPPLWGFAANVAGSLLLLFLLQGGDGPLSLLRFFAVINGLRPTAGAFPSVFRFTGEMQPLRLMPFGVGGGLLSLFGANQDSIFGRLGGLCAFLAALSAIPLCRFAEKRPQPESVSAAPAPSHALRAEAAVLLPWLLGSLLISLAARRFTKVAVLPLCVLAGLAAGSLARLPALRQDRARPLYCFFLAALLVLPSGLYSFSFSRGSVPSATDPMQQAMETVRAETPPDAVVAAWWDDGYFIEEAARRRALGDGMTDGSVSCASRFFFLSRALLSSDLRQAAAILRMLEYAGAEPLLRLTAWGLSQPEAAELLLSLCAAAEDPAEVSRVLARSGLSASRQQELSALLFPEGSPPLLIKISSDLLKKWIPLCWYGRWDPAAGASAPVSGLSASRASAPLLPGETCTLQMGAAGLPLCLRMDAQGIPEVTDASDPSLLRWGSVSVWRDGVLLRQTENGVSDKALLLLLEGENVCAFVCDESLRNSLLIRLFVCGDRSQTTFRLITEVLSAETAAEKSGAQRRLTFEEPTGWCTQVWELISQ